MANGWSRKPSEPGRVKNGRILHALSDVARQPTLITAWVNPLFVHLRLRSEAGCHGSGHRHWTLYLYADPTFHDRGAWPQSRRGWADRGSKLRRLSCRGPCRCLAASASEDARLDDVVAPGERDYDGADGTGHRPWMVPAIALHRRRRERRGARAGVRACAGTLERDWSKPSRGLAFCRSRNRDH